MFSGRHIKVSSTYKQILGLPMGSSLSAIPANVVMEVLEKKYQLPRFKYSN